jgi:hypothetical protein
MGGEVYYEGAVVRRQESGVRSKKKEDRRQKRKYRSQETGDRKQK